MCLFDISPINSTLYDEFFEKTINSLTMESVVIFTSQSNAQHAEELNSALLKHQDKDPYSACRTFVKFVGVEAKDKVPVPYNLKSDDPIGDPAIAPE